MSGGVNVGRACGCQDSGDGNAWCYVVNPSSCVAAEQARSTWVGSTVYSHRPKRPHPSALHWQVPHPYIWSSSSAGKLYGLCNMPPPRPPTSPPPPATPPLPPGLPPPPQPPFAPPEPPSAPPPPSPTPGAPPSPPPPPGPRLIVSGRRLLLDGQPHLMRGMVYSPTPIGIAPTEEQSLDFFTAAHQHAQTPPWQCLSSAPTRSQHASGRHGRHDIPTESDGPLHAQPLQRGSSCHPQSRRIRCLWPSRSTSGSTTATCR